MLTRIRPMRFRHPVRPSSGQQAEGSTVFAAGRAPAGGPCDARGRWRGSQGRCAWPAKLGPFRPWGKAARHLCSGTSEVASESSSTEPAEPPSGARLRMLFIANALPFIGFGFLDNFLMIIFGDAIDNTLCVALGFSTMAAAAIGNTLSDTVGIFAGGCVETMATQAGIEEPELTWDQKQLFITKLWQYGGQCFGIVLGCILGSCPLLWIDPKEAERLKKQKEQEETFKTVVVKVGEMLGAEAVALMFTDSEKNELVCKAATPNLPEKFNWEMDAGFMGHVATTGQFVNIADAENEPLYVPALHDNLLGRGIRVSSLLCMPVFSKGQVAGLFWVINKTEKPSSFTTKDEDVLSAICSHVSNAISDDTQTIHEILENCEKSMQKQGAPEWNISAKQRKMALYEPALEGICSFLNCEAAALMLIDTAGEELYTETIAGPLPKHSTKVGVGVAGRAAERGQIFVVDESDPYWQGSRHRNYQGSGIIVRSEVVVPLFDTSRKCLGVIKCINKDSPQRKGFDADDVDYITQVGQHLSIMLEGPEAGLKKVLCLTRMRMQAQDLRDHEPGVLCYIEQAQHLHPAHTSAVIDPYVTFQIVRGDPLQNPNDLEQRLLNERRKDRARPVRRFAKSQTILKNPDPQWNDTIHLSMPPELRKVRPEELFVHVLIWDYHSIGEDNLAAQYVFPYAKIPETGDGMTQSYPLMAVKNSRREYRLDKAKIWLCLSRAGNKSNSRK